MVQRRQNPSEPLVGLLTRQKIEQDFPDWRNPKDEEDKPELTAAKDLGHVSQGALVTVYLGTWCGDSRRELSRWWRALDMLGTTPPFDIRYIGVDRQKQGPHVASDLDLRFIPTFVVSREGRELGRVVESAPRGIEVEIKSLISGEKQGIISGRTNL